MSVKGGTLYFTEVKYRKTPMQGGGLAAITTKKLNQMRFAAKFYMQAKQVTLDAQMAAISMTGDPPETEEFLLVE